MAFLVVKLLVKIPFKNFKYKSWQDCCTESYEKLDEKYVRILTHLLGWTDFFNFKIHRHELEKTKLVASLFLLFRAI